MGILLKLGRLWAILCPLALLVLIFKYAQEAGEELNITVYIVGGYIRDLILKRTLKDIDLMVEKKAEQFASKLAKKLAV